MAAYAQSTQGNLRAVFSLARMSWDSDHITNTEEQRTAQPPKSSSYELVSRALVLQTIPGKADRPLSKFGLLDMCADCQIKNLAPLVY